MLAQSIVGPAGRLEISYLESTNLNAPLALFLHPDPQIGGSMNNRIIYNLFKQFSRHDYTCLRFNYRGVGKSEASFDNGEGELIDAATALDYLQLKNENSRGCCIVGYSFGAWIAVQLMMRRPEVNEFLLVAPPFQTHNFEFLGPAPERGLVIVPENDSQATALDLDKFLKQFHNKPQISASIISDANHFFSNKDEELADIVSKDFLSGAARQ